MSAEPLIPQSDYADRRIRLVEAVRESSTEAFWVTNLVNVRYLTGFTGSYAQLLITPEETIFFTDGRYEEQAAEQVSGCTVNIFKNVGWPDVFKEEVTGRGWTEIGFEPKHLTIETLERQKALVGESVRWTPQPAWVESLRLVKDEYEIEVMRQSSAIVDEVFPVLVDSLREGITEKQVLHQMLNLFWDHGAKGPSFDPIVLFGARSSLPHGQPGDAELRKGDWVLFDFGALFEGYCSDYTRTFVFGEPTSDQVEKFEAVHSSYRAAFDAVRPGVACKEIDTIARDSLAAAGLGELFIHGLGHGTGLEIHEGPRLAQTSSDTLQSGNVVTIEPGIYIPGWGGIRLENAVVVREDGPEPLTHTPFLIQPRG